MTAAAICNTNGYDFVETHRPIKTGGGVGIL